MKYRIRKEITRVVLLTVFGLCFSIGAMAQVGPCDPFNPAPDCAGFDPDNEVPIDGGASLLIAAGVAYGVKKIYNKKGKNKEEAI